MNTHDKSALDALHMQIGQRQRFNYKLRRVIASVLYHTPFSGKILKLKQELVRHLVNIDVANRQTKEFIIKHRGGMAAEKATQFDSGFGYESSFRELEIAEHYRSQVESGQLAELKSESGVLYDAVLQSISQIIEQDSEVKKQLNFGVCYGYIDNLLAQKYPNHSFFGVDRSAITKFYNEQYLNQQNLAFIAGDCFETMQQREWNDSILLHVRTLTCLPQNFVEKFYATAAERGFKYIVCAEQCGISWETDRPYAFSLEDQESVVFRNYMYIHNYPGLMRKAGYEPVQSQLLETKHPDPNFRIVLVVGKLTEAA